MMFSGFFAGCPGSRRRPASLRMSALPMVSGVPTKAPIAIPALPVPNWGADPDGHARSGPPLSHTSIDVSDADHCDDW